MSTDASFNYNSEAHTLFKNRVAFLMAILTMCIAIIAYWQNYALQRDAEADRDIKRLAIEALGREISDGIRINYHNSQAYLHWYELDILSINAENNGDQTLAKHYETVRDEMTVLSPLLAAPYFDIDDIYAPDLARYEAETYLVDVTVLYEELAAASVVKDGWDDKANTYIVHLTLLAVSLFLFGLSITISGQITSKIFSGLGLLIALFTIAWAINVWRKPIFDLREQEGAIDAFARGFGLAHQERWEESIRAYDEALQVVPTYSNALAERAWAYQNLAEYEAAVADYEQAHTLGNQPPFASRQLVWTNYLLGHFDEAIRVSQTALQARPDALRTQFFFALNLLATGQVDAALAEYEKGGAWAVKRVAEARAIEQEPSSNLWYALDEAATDLDYLLYILEDGESLPGLTPEPDEIPDPDAVQRMAPELIEQLKSLSVALEYTSQPPVGELTAELSPFEFGKPISDEEGKITEYELSDTFSAEIDEIIALFEQKGMQEGDQVVTKLYVNDVENVSWRQVFKWSASYESNDMAKINVATFSGHLDTGEYKLELYINTHLAQSGTFMIEEEQ